MLQPSSLEYHYSCMMSNTQHVFNRSMKDEHLIQHYMLLLTYCGNGRHNLSELELVQNRSFSSGIQTHHEDPHLLLPEHFEQPCKYIPHGG